MANEYIEISDKTLDDCITQACRKLKIKSDNLDYEVVDQGSLGFMGFNSRNAIIRARIKEDESGSTAASGDVLDNVHEKEPAESSYSGFDDTESDDDIGSLNRYGDKYSGDRYDRNSRGGRKGSYGRGKYGHSYDRGPRGYSSYDHSYDHDTYEGNNEDETEIAPSENAAHKSRPEEPHVDYTDEQVAEFEERADHFLKPMFHAMGMEVVITYKFDHEENILNIDFEGDDMGVLIGKRGQTLDSVQYLTSLIVNKDIPGYVHVKADTENYRERRKKTLENLAKNIAMKVKRTHRAQSLEPMNPYERRIIHSALQNDRYVTTYSEGEDPYRRVVITPKR